MSRSGGMADALDSKSSFPKGSVGSSPTFGTEWMVDGTNAIVMNAAHRDWAGVQRSPEVGE